MINKNIEACLSIPEVRDAVTNDLLGLALLTVAAFLFVYACFTWIIIKCD